MQVVRRYPTNRQHRHVNTPDDLLELSESAGRHAWVSGGGKDVAESQVIGAIARRALRFIEAVDGAADQEVMPRQLHSYLDRQTLTSQVDASGANTKRHIQPIIDDQMFAMLTGNRLELHRLGVQRCG